MTAAVGFSVHTGWAAVVAVGAPPRLLDRRRLVLWDGDWDWRFVYHAAAQEGDGETRIPQAVAAARRLAVAGIRALVKELGVTVAALPKPKRALPPLETILASHPLLHTAEGELYRRAVEEGCRAARLEIVFPTPELPDLGKPGPPWGKDQREAAALAWGALVSRR